MKKAILTALTLALFAFGQPQAHAQFLKKVGKALEKVDKAVDKALSTGSAVSSATTAATTGGVRVVNKLNGFTVEYKGVTWQEDFCGIDFVVTNQGDEAVRVYYFDKLKAFGADGSEYAARSIVGRNVTSLGNGDFDFEPGVPVKCTYALFDLPEGGTTMSLCQVRTQQHDPKQGYQDRYIEFRNVPIPARAAAATGPFKGVWTLKDNGLEGKLTLDFYGKSVTGMNAMGDELKCYGTIYLAYGSGAGVQVDDCPITAWKANGNVATVTYEGGRDGNTYSSVLTYNPANGQISVSGTVVVKDEGMGDCFVQDDLVFKK